jgi:hypothetical protein
MEVAKLEAKRAEVEHWIRVNIIRQIRGDSLRLEPY